MTKPVEFANAQLSQQALQIARSYGLDVDGRYRNLPYVGVLSDDLMPEGA